MRPHSTLFFSNKDIKNPTSGGGVDVIFRLARTFIKEGVSATLITTRFPRSVKEETIDGIKVIRIGGLFTVYPYAILKYLQLIRTIKPHLVVDCALNGIPFFTPLYVKKTPIIALYFHLNKNVFLMELPRIGGRVKGPILARIAYLIEDRVCPVIYRNVLKVTFSESTKKEMVELRFGRRIVILQEGIDLTKYRRGGRKSAQPLLLYVGRLKKYKAVQDAIKSLKIISRDFPNARLSVVGRGDYKDQLMSLSKRLGLEKNVIFHGYINKEKKIKLLQEAHLLVMPSYKEGWATPVIEANACGTPAVATDAAGVRETIRQGETGFIYPTGDYRKMAEYIAILLEDHSLRRKMSNNALMWARNFDWYRVENKFVSICKKLMG